MLNPLDEMKHLTNLADVIACWLIRADLAEDAVERHVMLRNLADEFDDMADTQNEPAAVRRQIARARVVWQRK